MRLLFTAFSLPYLLRDADYPTGGWPTQLTSWLDGLASCGHDAGVLTWKGANEYVGHAYPFELCETYDPKRGVKVLKYFYSYIPAILRAARRFRPDVLIQAAAGVDTGIMAFAGRRLGVPFVHRITSDVDTDGRYRLKLRGDEQIAFRYGLANASAILCQNSHQLGNITKAFPAKPAAIIHNPFRLPDRDLRIRPRSERSFVAWLGNFRSPKNLPLLLLLARKLPAIEFRVAGMPANNMDEESRKTVEELKSQSNVRLVGYVKRTQVIDFLSGAVALLNTSRYEGFSNTFLEAFAAGTPVVAPRRVDADLVVTDRKLGITAEDDAALVQAIETLWRRSDEEFASLAIRCRSYVEIEHSPERKVRELMAVLESLVIHRTRT